MAGSKLNFLYTSDSGVEYVVSLDESNTKGVNGQTVGALTPTNNPGIKVPRNIKTREVYYQNAAGTRTIRCVPLTPAIYQALLTPPFATFTDPIDSAAPDLNLARAAGERRAIPRSNDSGLNDATPDVP